MGLLQKRPITGSNAPLYTLGQTKTVLIIGLGNIGAEYDGTRHNIGFSCVDYFASKYDFPAWTNKKDLKCQMTSTTLGAARVILCKPTTFMNLSGEAAQEIQQFYKIASSATVAVYDDIDIDFGSIRTRTGGGSAGHNGIKSLISSISDQFGRIRIGVGPKDPPQIDSADFVLAKFNKDQSTNIKDLHKEVSSILNEYIHGNQTLTDTTLEFIQ